jgi:molybdopterin converting factor subunit 1
MTIEIRFFARAKDLINVELLSAQLPDGTTVGALRQWLGRTYPQLSNLLSRTAIAVNEEFADDSHVLESGVEVAVLPPVSGG